MLFRKISGIIFLRTHGGKFWPSVAVYKTILKGMILKVFINDPCQPFLIVLNNPDNRKFLNSGQELVVHYMITRFSNLHLLYWLNLFPLAGAWPVLIDDFVEHMYRFDSWSIIYVFPQLFAFRWFYLDIMLSDLFPLSLAGKGKRFGFHSHSMRR